VELGDERLGDAAGATLVGGLELTGEPRTLFSLSEVRRHHQ